MNADSARSAALKSKPKLGGGACRVDIAACLEPQLVRLEPQQLLDLVSRRSARAGMASS